MTHNFPIGTRVRIKDVSWFMSNSPDELGGITIPVGVGDFIRFTTQMRPYLGKSATIVSQEQHERYFLQFDKDISTSPYYWVEEMFEPLDNDGYPNIFESKPGKTYKQVAGRTKVGRPKYCKTIWEVIQEAIRKDRELKYNILTSISDRMGISHQELVIRSMDPDALYYNMAVLKDIEKLLEMETKAVESVIKSHVSTITRFNAGCYRVVDHHENAILFINETEKPKGNVCKKAICR